MKIQDVLFYMKSLFFFFYLPMKSVCESSLHNNNALLLISALTGEYFEWKQKGKSLVLRH